MPTHAAGEGPLHIVDAEGQPVSAQAVRDPYTGAWSVKLFDAAPRYIRHLPVLEAVQWADAVLGAALNARAAELRQDSGTSDLRFGGAA